MTTDIQLIEQRLGDCGCPEEVYLFEGVDLTIHFEPTGQADAFLDAGDWELETSVIADTREAGRVALFAWAAVHLRPAQEVRPEA